MQTVLLKLDDDLLKDVDKVVEKTKVSRNRYINNALKLYTLFNKRRYLKAQFAKESKLVSKESLSVLKEFEILEDAAI